MTENDKNMIAGLPFQAAAKEIGAVITGLEVIQSMAESNAARNLANEALDEAIIAERQLSRAKSIITDGEEPTEPSLTHLFMKLREDLYEVQQRIADEYSCGEDADKQADLAQAKSLLSDCAEIIERAEARATYLYKGTLQPRIFIGTWAEYFTFDPTTSKVHYCHIPEEYRK